MSEIEQGSPEEGRNMSSNTLEVLDANIVILPEEPLKQIVNAISLFEGSELAPFMKKPLTFGQGRWACGRDRDADGIADGLASQVEMMTEGVALIPSVS
jgi:hypothetical protein